MTGRLFLVGAGPGDPDLITVKGLRCLRQADVVLHDRLVAPELLDEIPPQAERIFVGKRPGLHIYPQEEINALILEKARQGKTVVRLKGGDPLLFGRGAEEALACAQAGIPFEIVPGVSSAFGVPAYAGIPVTHRGTASSVAIITGHETPEKGPPQTDWASLCHIDTLVILMGLRQLPQIMDQLLQHGRTPETPAASIEWGTLPKQRVVEGTLATLAEEVRRVGLVSPVLTVVGKVVEFRHYLKWSHDSPDTTILPK